MVTAATESADETIGKLAPNVRICGITKGHFSLLDLIRAVLKQTGPCDVQLTTWSSGIRDAQTAKWLIESGDIRTFRILTDRSFPVRQPQYTKKLLELFGADSIHCSKVHCKVAVLRNDDWNIVIRSSMNLNRNPRFEQFDLDDDLDLAVWWCNIFDEIRDGLDSGFLFGSADVEVAFEKVWADKKKRTQAPKRDLDLSSDFDMDFDGAFDAMFKGLDFD